MDETAENILRDFSFSKYETSCYLALLTHHPANGSQLSKLSGIARSRIYDVLRGLMRKGLVFEVTQGSFVPLPFTELKKRLRSQVEANLAVLEEQLGSLIQEQGYEYLMPLRGYETAVKKAAEIIDTADCELYVRLFPDTGVRLLPRLERAAARGVGIRYIAMGEAPLSFDIQVVHPASEKLLQKLGGETIDIIADKAEALVGMFDGGQGVASPIIWTRNRWFVIANRDSLRHDFYHYFLDKLYDRGEPLSPREKRIYEFIKADD